MESAADCRAMLASDLTEIWTQADGHPRLTLKRFRGGGLRRLGTSTGCAAEDEAPRASINPDNADTAACLTFSDALVNA